MYQTSEPISRELEELQTEYLDFKETSKLIEDEMEKKIAELTKTVDSLLKENKRHKNEAETLKLENERNIRRNGELEKTLKAKEEEIAWLKGKIVDLENFNEEGAQQKRATENLICELEEKINSLLEKLALMQTEFEINKTEASEQIRLLNNQLKETEFQIQMLSLKNSKTMRKTASKEIIQQIVCKVQLKKQSQSNSDIKTTSKREPTIALEASKKQLFPSKKPPLPQPTLENSRTPTLITYKGKSHKSFHKPCDKSVIGPPLKFGLTASNNLKNLIKKMELKTAVS